MQIPPFSIVWEEEPNIGGWVVEGRVGRGQKQGQGPGAGRVNCVLMLLSLPKPISSRSHSLHPKLERGRSGSAHTSPPPPGQSGKVAVVLVGGRFLPLPSCACFLPASLVLPPQPRGSSHTFPPSPYDLGGNVIHPHLVNPKSTHVSKGTDY